ncbi:hypothetical protein D3C79_807540 [compost metagenome]
MARLSPPAGLLRVASQASGYWRARLTDWPGLVMTKSSLLCATASASASSSRGTSAKRRAGTRSSSHAISGCHCALASAGPRVASTPMRTGSLRASADSAWGGTGSARAGASQSQSNRAGRELRTGDEGA